MEKSIEELLAFFQRYGGIADFTGIDDDIRLFWQLPIRYLSDALEPARVSAEEPDRILTSYVALVLNGGFNAVVRHEPDAAIAGIFIGVPLIAFKACRLLALRLDLASGLPTRDESERLVVYPEKLTLPTSWQLGPDPCRQALDDITAFEEATPLDNNELATFMFDIMMRYVAMHECMHFVLGHARFCQIELGMNAFEDGNERRRELGGHTSQTMEFISDRHVIAGLSHDLQRGRLYHEWSRQPPEAIGVEPERWYRRILFVTLGLISRLWVLHGSAGFGNLSQPYPHPYERLCWMHASLIEIEGDALAHDTMEAVGLREDRLGALLVVSSSEEMIERLTRSRRTKLSPVEALYSRLFVGRQLCALSPQLACNAAALDGAVVIDQNGIVRGIGCIFETGQRRTTAEGARTRAALFGSKDGVALKISQDGEMSIFSNGNNEASMFAPVW